MIAPDSASGQVTASPRVRIRLLYRSLGRKHSIGRGVDWNPGVVKITAKTHIFLFHFFLWRNTKPDPDRPRRPTPGFPRRRCRTSRMTAFSAVPTVWTPSLYTRPVGGSVSILQFVMYREKWNIQLFIIY